MKIATFYLINFLYISLIYRHNVIGLEPSDNDFSEFDEFDESDIKIENPNIQNIDEHVNSIVENNEHQAMNDEFQNLELDEDEVTIEEEEDKSEIPSKKQGEKPFEPIKLSSLPLHLRNNWTSYYIEISLMSGIVIYFINFFIGSKTNQKLALTFWHTNVELLKSYFSVVGDNGEKELDKQAYIQESNNTYILWSSGRFGYECCIIELHLNKRQDLLNILWSFIRPNLDNMIIKIFLRDDAMDSFVFCLAHKKNGLKVVKEYNDVVTFCSQRKSIEKYTFLNDNFILLNEIGDVTSLVLDNQLLNLLSQYPELINFIHISDQFSGPKPGDQENQQTKAPPIKKVLTLSFNFPKEICSSDGMEMMKEFLAASLNLSERVRRYKLKKDMKQKALANRKKIEEYYEKLQNAEKREAAQLKKEEKRRLEKEKIIDANDEFKLRKFEDREYKKEMKKKLKPKIKQVRA